MLQNAYFLAKSVPIQPKTSNILPKFCQKLTTTLRCRASWRRRTTRAPARGDAPLARHFCRQFGHLSQLPKLSCFANFNFLQNFPSFWRARSPLYPHEILQENMRLTAFCKLYKICILFHRCNLKIFAQNRFEKSAMFVKIEFSKKFAHLKLS